MTVLVELAVPTSAFELGELLQPPPGVEIELVEFVPVDEGAIPYIWVESDAKRFKQFERRVRTDDRVNDLWSVDAQGGRRLVRLDWERTRDGFLDACLSEEVIIQHGMGTSEGWRFQLRFADRAAAAAFQRQCVDANIPFTVLRITDPGWEDGLARYGLTEAQLEALLLAHERGYFENPRGVTLAELGEELGITRQAVSYRIRAGTRNLIDATLRTEYVGTEAPPDD